MNFLEQYVKKHLGWSSLLVKKAYGDLQQAYRSKQQVGYTGLEQIQAYVFTRFPATYGVCVKLIKQHLLDLNIHSVLDWGSGIGTASLALNKYFENLECFLVEQDSRAKSFAAQFLKNFYPNINVYQHDDFSAVDLSIFSYSLGEVSDWQTVIDKSWNRTKYLLIIEPGTPAHFKKLIKVRDYLLAKKAYLWAPCCHAKLCPLKNDDWCHFSARIDRSKEHKNLKNASRGFENEAYSYMLFSKDPKSTDFGRVVSSPRIHGGHVDLKICTNQGEILYSTVGKSAKDYKTLKKTEWGDSIKHELL